MAKPSLSTRNFGFLLVLCLTTPSIHTAQGWRHFGDHCAKNRDCVDTEFCQENRCSCPSITNRLYTKYNPGKKICESFVDSVCSMIKEKDGKKLRLCVENAVCIVKPGKIPITLGICECKHGFFARDGICGHFQKTMDIFQTKSRDHHARVPWGGSESTSLHQGPIIFGLTVALPFLAWVPC